MIFTKFLLTEEVDSLHYTLVSIQLAMIYKSCDGVNLRRAMFSATFAYDVEEWCKLNLDNVIQVYIGAR